MTRDHAETVIVGAGLAGARCAEALRGVGFAGRIVVLGDEPHAPYERPALSKDVLTGKRHGASLALRDRSFWDAQRIDLRCESRVDALDLEARTVTASGARLSFDHLVLATGLRARRLPAIPDGPGIHTLRTLADAEALRRELRPGTRLAVIGAGFVGLEVASSAISIGTAVTVVDLAATPCARALGPEVGGRLGERARAAGVELRPGRSVVGVQRDDRARPRAIVLDDGSSVACDVLLVGAGAVPNTQLVHGQLGLADDGGIVTDAVGRTASQGVYACGDVASRRAPGAARPLRHEHWGAAASTARAVASAISGAPAPDEALPFFWSDQFGWRLQAVGLPDGDLAVDIDEDGNGLVARYREDGRLVGAVTVNRPHELSMLRGELADASQAALGAP
jgi:3-phenylpropionate/trans-cinnamate dioxygenase ferredoxin reductase subunit